MKRLIPFVAAVLVALSAQAQSVNVHMADGNNTVVKYNASKVDYIDFTKPIAASDGLEAVDLGLPSGRKWANMNIGATAPEDYGIYFSWGETQPKDFYDWNSYQWGAWMEAFQEGSIKKYNTALNPEDDAATMNWGGKWRMPTKKEFEELIANTTATFELKNDSAVIKLTSNVNGASIYLPIAGFWNGTTITTERQYAYYWTSTLSKETVNNKSVDAYSAFFEADGSVGDKGVASFRRPVGHTVRSVIAKSDVSVYSIAPAAAEAVDMGLSVMWANMNVGAESEEEWGNFYAWGETGTKHQYGWYYSYATGVDAYGTEISVRVAPNYKFGAYDTEITGYTGATMLEPADDAATANWGNEWRTPTREDFEELFENTKQKKDVVNNIKGVRFISKTNSSNSIFIPYSGYKKEDKTVDADAIGGCWTSTLHPEHQNKGILYKFSHDDASATKLSWDYRPAGWPIRPVKK